MNNVRIRSIQLAHAVTSGNTTQAAGNRFSGTTFTHTDARLDPANRNQLAHAVTSGHTTHAALTHPSQSPSSYTDTDTWLDPARRTLTPYVNSTPTPYVNSTSNLYSNSIPLVQPLTSAMPPQTRPADLLSQHQSTAPDSALPPVTTQAQTGRLHRIPASASIRRTVASILTPLRGGVAISKATEFAGAQHADVQHSIMHLPVGL